MTRDGKFPPKVLEAMETLFALGVEVVPVTGRSAGEALGLARYLPTVKRAIAENGGVMIIPDRPHEVLLGTPDKETVLSVAIAIADEGEPLEPAPCSAFRIADVAFERAGRSQEVCQVLQVSRLLC